MKILACDKVASQGVEILQKDFEVVVKDKISHEELLAMIPEFEGLIVRSESKVTKDIIDAAKNLKIIGRAGVGVDNIDVEAATNRGIVVINSPGGNTIAATEHTIALLLAMARNVPQAYQSMKAGKWERSKFVGIELRGKVLGVIGLGRIGGGVAKRAQAHEMKIMAYDPYITEEKASELDIELASVQDIIEKADFITVHVPKTKETANLLNAKAFEAMKPGVRIINVARGGIVNENDLYEALKSGKVAAAALDVFEKEPADPTHPLFTLDNVIVTPHLGASTQEAQIGVSVDVAESMSKFLKGEQIRTAVNMAPVAADVLNIIQPYFPLAERMGCLAVHLADGRISEVEIVYSGEIAEKDVKPLSTAALKGMLDPILTESVNMVNAPVLAKSRGIKVREVRSHEAENFANLITIKAKTEKGIVELAGTLFGKANPRVVRIDGYRVDVEPTGWLLIAPHTNRPGVVGKLGSLLGQNSINISGMQVGTTTERGTSMMALAVDSMIPDEVMEKVKAMEEIFDAKLVAFADAK